MEVWEVVLTSILGNTIVIALLGYLGNALIGNLLQKDLLTYKSSLQKEVDSFKQSLEQKANQELEKYKSQLEIERLRLQISYGGIFEKQANAILEIYKALIGLDEAASRYLKSFENGELRDQYFESLANALKIISINRILLPEQLDYDLSKFMSEYFSSVSHYNLYNGSDLSNANHDDNNEERQLTKEMISKYEKMVYQEIPKLKNDLVSYMRKTLGIIQL